MVRQLPGPRQGKARIGRPDSVAPARWPDAPRHGIHSGSMLSCRHGGAGAPDREAGKSWTDLRPRRGADVQDVEPSKARGDGSGPGSCPGTFAAIKPRPTSAWRSRALPACAGRRVAAQRERGVLPSGGGRGARDSGVPQGYDWLLGESSLSLPPRAASPAPRAPARRRPPGQAPERRPVPAPPPPSARRDGYGAPARSSAPDCRGRRRPT